MWPKMLFELLPHVGRIVPMAERFFETRKAREQEEQAQFAAITETLRTELGRTAEATSAIERSVKDQAGQVSAIAAETSRSRAAMEALDGRMRRLEEKVGAADSSAPRLQVLLVVAILLLIVVLGLLVVLLVRGGGR